MRFPPSGICPLTLSGRTRNSQKRLESPPRRRLSGRNEMLISRGWQSRRAEDLSATQAAQQVALRQKFGDSAKAAADALSSEIAALTKDPWTKDDQKRQIAIFYPAYAAWLADKLADHWEIMTIDTEVQDFGASNFKGRSARYNIRPDHPTFEEPDAWRIQGLLLYFWSHQRHGIFDAERARLRQMRRRGHDQHMARRASVQERVVRVELSKLGTAPGRMTPYRSTRDQPCRPRRSCGR